MKISQAILFLFTLITTIHAFALPDFNAIADSTKQLIKRKGGGGRGGGGGRTSSSSSSSSSSSRLTRPNSVAGGTTTAGSGPQPRAYRGGNTYYPGGAPVPYKAGNPTPGGVNSRFIGAAGLGIFPGVWLYGAYAYSYPGHYLYHNRTSNQNETHPMECLCGRFQECGCNANNQTDYVTDIANNNTVSRLATVDGVKTLVVNGTLPNGTTAASGAPAFSQSMSMAGWGVIAAGVTFACFM